jgi:carboxyl-terminal processing protease
MAQPSNTATFLSTLTLMTALLSPAAIDDATAKPQKQAQPTEQKEQQVQLFDEETQKKLLLLGIVKKFAESNAYASETNKSAPEQDSFVTAMKAIVQSIDPHSDYLTEKEFSSMQEDMKGGQFGGLGMELTTDKASGLPLVIAPFEDMPAEKAGIKNGDLIGKIDKEKPKNLEDAVKKMRGTPDTPVHLEIYRKGNEKPIPFDLTRKIVETKPVRTSMVGDIGVIRISTYFNETVAEKVENAFATLKNQNPNIKGLIIDERNNPGGITKQAESIVDSVLDSGLVDTLRMRPTPPHQLGELSYSYEAKKGDITNGLPIVVLTNNGSASASEIVAGALQGNGRATILGEGNTFGKGSAQGFVSVSDIFKIPSLKPLAAMFKEADLTGVIKLTQHLYFLPDGKGGERSIQNIGVAPDIEYQPPKTADQNALIKESGLNSTIANPLGANDNGKDVTKSFCTAASDQLPPNVKLEKSLLDRKGKPDYQLICAAEFLGQMVTPNNVALTVIKPKEAAPALTQ